MVNLNESFNSVTNYFSPKVIGEVNDVYIKIAKIKGEDVPWHTHEDEDEMFLVIDGSLLFEIKNQNPFTLSKGEMFIVKKGIEHRVSSTQECKIMLIENKTTLHTGAVQSEITKTVEDQLKD